MRLHHAIVLLLTCSLLAGGTAASAQGCGGCKGTSCGVKAAAEKAASPVLANSALFQLARAMNNLASTANAGPDDMAALEAVNTVNLCLSEYLLAVRHSGQDTTTPALEDPLLALTRLQRMARDVGEADRHIRYMEERMKDAALSRKGDLLLTEFLTRLRGRAYRDLMLQLDKLRADDLLAIVYQNLNDGMAAVMGGFDLIDAVTFHQGVLHVADAEQRIIHLYRFESTQGDTSFPLDPVKIGTIEALSGGEGETQGIIYDAKGNLLVVDEGSRQVYIFAKENGSFVPVGTLHHPVDLLHVPRGIAVTRAGDILVSDAKKRRIHVFDRDYRHQRTFEVFPDAHTQIECMIPLEKDTFIITNEFGHTLGRYTLQGESLGEFGRLYFTGQPEGIVCLPGTVNGQQAFMVVDELMGELEIFSLKNQRHLKTIRLGTGEGLYNLKSPDGIALGNIGGAWYLFISDQKNGRVVIYNLEKLITLGDFCTIPDAELLGICNDLYDFMAARKFGLGSVTQVALKRAKLAWRMAEYIEANPFSRALFDKEIEKMRLGVGIDIVDEPLIAREIDRLMADVLKLMSAR